MKKTKRMTALFVATAMAITSAFITPATSVKAEETTVQEVITQDSWVDPGNYTRGWYDSVTDKDIYGNTGTEEDPYEIKSTKDLAGLAYYSNIIATDSATTDFGGKYITITATSIDLGEHYWYPIGAVQNFKGTVDGNDVVIQNMYIGSESEYETCGKVGLFGSIFADVGDITIKNAKIYSNSTYAGGFVGYWGGGNIENCSVEGSMNHIASRSYVGGFVGYHTTNNLSVTDCSAKIPVVTTSSSSNIGGFIGYCGATTSFMNCNTSENVSGGASNCIGGFAGNSAVCTYTNCFALGNAISNGNSNRIGGFTGYSTNGTYVDCYANGNVTSPGANCYLGGFAGYCPNGTYTNCYANGDVTSDGDTCALGGFIGHSTSGTFLDCHADGSVTSLSGTNCYSGGLIGNSTNGTFTDCYALGNIESQGVYYAGGFIGNSETGTLTQCFSIGNVTITSGMAGGFIGGIRCNSVYNSYALGNVEAGNSSNIAGFIGYAWNNGNSSSYSCSMNIENCYSAGSVKAGTSSTVAGFFGQRQYSNSTITFKKAYWNVSQNQVANGIYRTNDAKVGVTNATYRTVVGAYMDYMKSTELVADLNEYVYQNADSYDEWMITKDVNNGYPYISGYKSALLTIVGDSKEVEVQNDGAQSTNDMNVYGTLVFPSQEPVEPMPTQTPTPTPDTEISVVLSWGSLEYIYTAGEFDEETQTYADGTWAAKEEGVSDKITLTNYSSEDVEVSYNFTASTETGNFSNLTGTFYQEDRQTAITAAIPVRRTQGDIASIHTAFLNISGVPTTQESITTPELLGSVLVTVNKYEEVTEEPETTEDVVTTETPTTEDVETTETPATEDVVMSETPATEDVVMSETPTTEDVAKTETPVTEEAVTSEEPVTTEVVTTDTPAITE